MVLNLVEDDPFKTDGRTDILTAYVLSIPVHVFHSKRSAISDSLAQFRLSCNHLAPEIETSISHYGIFPVFFRENWLHGSKLIPKPKIASTIFIANFICAFI